MEQAPQATISRVSLGKLVFATNQMQREPTFVQIKKYNPSYGFFVQSNEWLSFVRLKLKKKLMHYVEFKKSFNNPGVAHKF